MEEEDELNSLHESSNKSLMKMLEMDIDNMADEKFEMSSSSEENEKQVVEEKTPKVQATLPRFQKYP